MVIIIISEFIRNVKNHVFLFLIVIMYLLIAFISLEFMFANINIFNLRSNSIFNTKGKNIKEYRLVDLAETKNYLNSYENVKLLKKFYNKFIDNKNYTYYESINQPVYVADFKGNEVFYYGYEYNTINEPYTENNIKYSHVNQVFINYNIAEKFNLNENILDGSMLKFNDFFTENLNKIPIIMGYEYSKYYKTGDLIKVSLSKNIYASYKIIGFLKKDTAIELNQKVTFLDRYIVTPSINLKYSPKTKEDILHQGFFYLQKINGIVKLQDNYSLQKFMLDLEQLRLEFNIFDIAILKYSPMEINALKFLVYENINTLIFIFILIFIVTIITSVAYMIHKININIYNYKVLMICGYSISDIRKSVIFELCITFFIPLLLSLFFLNIFMNNVLIMSLKYIAFIYLILFTIILILTEVYFINIGMEKLIKGDKYD